MTLFIVMLSVTNIALGYGLAIYLGHALAPWARDKRATNYHPPASGEKGRESGDDSTGTIDQKNDENNDKAAAETVAETADEPAKEVAEVKEELGAEELGAKELGANDETSPDEKPDAEIAGAIAGDAVEEEASDETPEVSAEQEVLDNLETIREEIHEQPEPPTVEEALATEVESSIPESQDEQETAASETVPDEELMQGIGAFQKQLEEQQEHSKLHAVSDTSKDQS